MSSMTVEQFISLSQAERSTILLDNWQEILYQALQRLKEIDSVPLSERARVTYTVGNMTFNWTEYRQSILDILRSAKDVADSLQGVIPFSLHYVVS